MTRRVAKAVNKASGMLGLVRATLTCLDEVTVHRLFPTMVCPHLENGNSIWYPRFRRDKVAVERQATKLIGISYVDRLRALSLPYLEYHRRRGDILQVFKIGNSIDRINSSTFRMNTESNTRGHDQKFLKKHARVGVRQSVFSQRVSGK